jgi:putative salt-induced outer membrane protein
MFKYFCFHLFLFFLFFSYNTRLFAKDWSSSIESGATIENGNSNTQLYYARVKVNHEFRDRWKNILDSRGENKKENNKRSKEEYRVNNQTRYSINKLNYSFVELEYIDDRYGGYDYRVSETFGLGKNIIKKDDLSFTVQSSFGARQIRFSDSDKEESAVIRFGSNLNWKFNSNVSFNEDFDISFDKNARIIKSDASLKVMMSKSLYLKFNLFIENKSKVPQGIKNTDSRTMIIIGYDF